MRRVFRAYVWRNPLVGYIQGINYPFFRIRKFLSEEDTFWLMCVVIESYLPPNFYVEMFGATTSAQILIKVFTQYRIFPDLLKKFEQLDYPLVNMTARLFLTLFCNAMPEQASLKILDLFLLEGLASNKIIFDIALGYLRVIEHKVVCCSDQEELQDLMTSTNPDIDNSENLFNNIKIAKNELL